ncbi:MAG: YebC/PmpR family DNA-binding transcriptional regulator [Christensenellales bacterium]|jgi:YebC/PmpR family DNA-binding regulatory protein|nr:YebC/PmpR family DNA-binding transcriptional regulator [Clostridiales bacterium]
MAGHSKWSNIKHKKGKADAARGNLFTKIGREISVAVKQGGADPVSNSRLRDVIAKAKQANMPNDNINRSIKKASGELDNIHYEEVVYEGYGPNGVAIIVEALTDNRNRTAGEVRHAFDKHGGSLGQTGCVGYMFNRKGVIVADKTMSDEDMMLLALEIEADDIVIDDEVYEIYVSPSDVFDKAEQLENAGAVILNKAVDMVPDNYITPENQETLVKLINALEDSDDVQNVYHNAELEEEEEEE